MRPKIPLQADFSAHLEHPASRGRVSLPLATEYSLPCNTLANADKIHQHDLSEKKNLEIIRVFKALKILVQIALLIQYYMR